MQTRKVLLLICCVFLCYSAPKEKEFPENWSHHDRELAEMLQLPELNADVEKIALLLQKGADPNSFIYICPDNCDYDECHRPYSEAVKTYSDCGPEIHTCLSGAVKKTNGDKLVRMPVNNGADPNQKITNGWTPLLLYVKEDLVCDRTETACCRIETMKALLDVGADLYAKTNDGKNALSFASQYCHKAVEMLIDYGLLPNATDKTGRSPLHYAKEAQMTKLLLDHGFNPNTKDNKEKTPVDIARVSQARSQMSILIDYAKKWGMSRL